MAAQDIAIRAERSTAIGTARIVRYAFAEPPDHLVPPGGCYQVDLAIAPRPANARGRYHRHWRADRYDRLGGVWMVPPGEAIHFRSDAGATTCVNCTLEPSAVAEWLGAGSGWSAGALEGTLDLRGGRLRALMAHVGEELRTPGFAGEAMVELLCAQIAIEISRHWRRVIEQGDGVRRVAVLAGWRLRIVEERIDAAGPVPPLVDLAALAGLSVRQLTRAYRAARGCSIGEAIATRRIERARALLASDRGIKAIAHDLGFASAAGFTYAFRKIAGETPRRYRDRIRPGRRAMPA